MRFSNNGAVAMAMAASVATATPHGPLGLDLPNKGLDLSKPIHAGVDLNADLSGKVLVAGLLADILVDPIAEVAAGAKVEVICDDCHIKGDIDASISLEKVVPALSLSLKDVEVLLDLDVYIGAAATIAVNLVAPAKVSLPLPALNVEAVVSLDLILGVHTELDVSAGVYVSLPEASLETNILDGAILDADFSGVVVKVLPIKVRIGCTELLADLRLRVDLSVAAALDVDEVLPLDKLLPGVHIPAVGAGLQVAVFANLLEYVGLFCAASECPLAKEAYGLNVGAAVELGVAVEDLLSIHLAPTVATALLTIPTHTVCVPEYTAVPTGLPGGPAYSGLPSGPGYSGAVPSQSLPGFPSRLPTGIPTGIPTDIPIGSGPGAGYPTGLLPVPTGSDVAATTAAPGAGDLITTTVSNVATYTVTACAVNVANCPAGYQTCATITHTTAYTTVCPATATASITEAAPAPTETHDIQTITQIASTMSSCSSASTFTPPASISTVPFPSDIPTPSVSVSVPETPATTAGPIPTVSQPAAGASYPVGPQTNSYPVRDYPVASSGPSASYPAGGASSSYPAPSSSGPAYPSTPVPTPSGPSYPSGGNNGTIPATSATYAPSQSSSVPSGTGYPTSPSTTSPVMAGAGKVGSSIAAVVALVGAVMFL